MDELSFNEDSSELSSDNKEVSSDKEAALLRPLHPAQKQTESLSSDNVPLLIANDFMVIFDEESSDVYSENAAAILQSFSGWICTVGNLRTTPLSGPVSIIDFSIKK